MGRFMAASFASDGWNVAMADLVAERVHSLANEISGKGFAALAVEADVRSDQSVASMVATVTARWPKIDVLVCAAGGYGQSFRPTHETPEDEWDMVVDSNMKGTFLCAKHVVPVMLKNGGGRIINFASNAARTVSPVLGCSYTAAKTGVIGITRHLSREYAGQGILVNTIAPGPIDGDRVSHQLLDLDQKTTLASSIPVGRLGQESEICTVVKFLASDAPSYMTGAIIDVNGGYVLA
jgi:NAD(P)-dependent dehydrogenase (short-subunit alcohol dehydrogenase family)